MVRMRGRSMATRWLGFAGAALVAGVVTTAGAQDPGAAAPGPQPITAEDLQRADAERKEREARRSTPQEQAARKLSRQRYAQLSDTAALGAVRKAFASLFDDQLFRPWRPAPGERVTGYRAKQHVAVVDRGEGKPKALVQSTLPLRVADERGELAPVSLALVAGAGGFAPENPLTDYTLPARLSDGAAFPQTRVLFSPFGGSRAPARRVPSGLYYSNVARDVDLLLAPLPAGVEAVAFVRSALSPERLPMTLAGAPGTQLSLDDATGGVRVSRDGQALGGVAPPMAFDADGEPVPVRYELRDGRLSAVVAHRRLDVKYPIAVDPAYVENQLRWSANAGLDFSGWSYNQTGPFGSVAGPIFEQRGLWTWLPPGSSPAGLQYGMWRFRAYGDTYVTGAIFEDFRFYRDAGRTCAGLGIYDDAAGWTPGRRIDHIRQDKYGPSPHLAICQQSWLNESHVADEVRRGNAAAIVLAANGNGPNGRQDSTMLGGAAVAIVDDLQPVNLALSGLPSSDWTRTAPATTSLQASAQDNGVGMYYVGVDALGSREQGAPRLVGENLLGGCEFGRNDGWHCPQTQSYGLSAELPEGITEYTLGAVDALGNYDERSWVVRIDRTPPALALRGGLWAKRGGDVSEATYPLLVDAVDAAPGQGGQETAGVRRLEFLVDGLVRDTRTQDCAANCGFADVRFELRTADYPAGPHTFQVRAVDGPGNERLSPVQTVTVTSGHLVTPDSGQKTSRRVTLQAKATRSGATSVRFQFRRPGSVTAGDWADIPLEALTDEQGATVAAAERPLTDSTSAPLSWDLLSTPALDGQDVPVEVRGLFSGGSAGLTQTVKFTLDQSGLDAKTARAPIGPGDVNLLTGNFSVGATDVAIPSALTTLTVSRTYNSRAAQSDATGPFGPGWTASLPIDEVAAQFARLEVSGSLVKLILADGSEVAFSPTSGGLTPELGFEGLKLAAGSGDSYVLTDLGGVATTFVPDATNASRYLPAGVAQPGSQTKTTYVTEVVAGRAQITRVIAPSPPGVDCTTAFRPGCRYLQLVYAASTTATGTTAEGWGSFAGRLSDVRLYATAPGGAAEESVVATYRYDSAGRLRAQWTPSLGLTTTYDYDARGLLTSIRPPGEEPWSLEYRNRPGDTGPGRLYQASRSALDNGIARWTVDYDVPLSGAGAPYAMGASDVAGWAQRDVPRDAAAVFPPDQVPPADPTDFAKATVYYLNKDGFEVNLALPGGAISTAERDRFGNVVRALTAENRRRALAAPSPPARAAEIDTRRSYSADGLDLLEELGPLHAVRLASGEDVQARRRATFAYDQGAPAGGPYHLPTTQTIAAQVAGRPDADARVTKTEYNWPLRLPEAVTVDPGAAPALNLVTRTVYDAATGLETERRQPRAPDGGAASTTKTTYYSAGASPVAECAFKPEWHNLPCRIEPAAQTANPVPVRSFQYDSEYNVTRESATSGAVVRTTTSEWAKQGRLVSRTVSASAAAGSAVDRQEYRYAPASGRLVAVRAVPAQGEAREVTKAFDDLGRLVSYTDSTGAQTTTSYDLLDRPVTVGSEKGTVSYRYDATTGRLAAIEDSALGTLSGTYDADGALLTQSYPTGLKASWSYDETGDATGLVYAKSAGCGSRCEWLSFVQKSSVHGQWLRQDGTLSAQDFVYDAAGRLVEVRDRPAGKACETRRYSYDADSNRTQLRVYGAGSGGACSSAGSPVRTVNHAYDASDHLVDAGYGYDGLGRTTTVPAGDAGGAQLTSSFYANDLVRSQSQAGRTVTSELDPLQRTRQQTTTGPGAGVEISRYGDDSDAPLWVSDDQADGAWRRNIAGLDGNLAAIDDSQTGVTLQLTNLHGDVVGTGATPSTVVEPVQTLTSLDGRTSERGIERGTWTALGAKGLPDGRYTARVELADGVGHVGRSGLVEFDVADGFSPREYRSVVLADGPMAYWRLAETSGTSAMDELGAASAVYENGVALGRTGALPGNAANRAAGLDGSDDRVRVTDATKLNFGIGSDGLRKPFTVEAWIKTGTANNGAFVAKGSPDHLAGWWLDVTNVAGRVGQVRLQLKTVDRGVETLYSSARVDDGRWHHVVASFGSTIDEFGFKTPFVELFVDGTSAGLLSGASGLPLDNDAAFQIGQLSGTALKSNPSFRGDIDDVAVYPRALTASDASAHAYAAFEKDTSGPGVSVTAPAAGATVTETTPAISGNAGNDQGDSHVVRVEVHRGSRVTAAPVQSLAVETTSGSWAYRLAKPLAAGRYTVVAKQSDIAGNDGASAPVTFTVAADATATSYRERVLASDPAAYWRLGDAAGSASAADQKAKFPATAGSGVTFGRPGSVAGDTDTAAGFGTSGSTLTVPNAVGLNPDDLTVAGWVKRTGSSGNVASKLGASSTGGWSLTLFNGQLRGLVRIDGTDFNLYGPFLAADRWHHVALVKAPRALELYVDGRVVARVDGDFARPFTSEDLRFGGGTSPYQGDLDELSLHGRALAPAAIYGLAAAGAPADATTPTAAFSGPPSSGWANGTRSEDPGDGDAVVVSIYPDINNAPLATFEADEFGVPRTGQMERQYAWLGGKRRSTEFPSGIVQMGVRSYLPSIGRFLQPDPVLGGSCNAYEYTCQDPLNVYDLDGRCPWCIAVGAFAVRAISAYAAKKAVSKAVAAGVAARVAGGVAKRIAKNAGRRVEGVAYRPIVVRAITKAVMTAPEMRGKLLQAGLGHIARLLGYPH